MNSPSATEKSMSLLATLLAEIEPSGLADALASAFTAKPAAWLYKFAAQTELTSETFLTAPIWHPCTGNPAALIKERGGE